MKPPRGMLGGHPPDVPDRHDAHSLQTLLGALSAYFEGEKIEALVFILPLGLLSLVFAGWLLTDGSPGFHRGLDGLEQRASGNHPGSSQAPANPLYTPQAAA